MLMDATSFFRGFEMGDALFDAAVVGMYGGQLRTHRVQCVLGAPQDLHHHGQILAHRGDIADQQPLLLGEEGEGWFVHGRDIITGS